jgi:imidazolonepropionase-like amidohydrolase
MRLVAFFLFFTPAFAQNIAITGATVVDGTGTPPHAATVLIRGDRIAAVGENLAIPPGARVIDASGKTLIPGLFDLHTHLAAAGTTTPMDWGKNLKADLVHGITSVVDMSTYPETYESMRRILPSIPGPHVAIAARITTPGGHGDEAGRGDFFSLEVLTPREGRDAIRRVVPYHPDIIKVFTDGWRYGTAPDMTSMDEATLAAIVDEAHKNNLPVLTHTVSLARAKIAARAGVDALAHGVNDLDADDELIALMKQHGTAYISTLAVFAPKGRPPSPRWPHLLHNIAALQGGGVMLGSGTDAGMPGTPHGSASLMELELMVQGGLTPLEAITAATGNSARAIRVDKERGVIAEGKLADLVLIDGAPYRDIKDIEKVKTVFLAGKEIDRAALEREIATPGVTPMTAIKASEKVDDFERADGRSTLDTFRIQNTDPGNDHSHLIYTTMLSGEGGNHVLSLVGEMSDKDKPFARILIPLSKGGFEPVDATAFTGVRFDVRGEGEYRLVVMSRTDTFLAPFTGEPKWRKVSVPFTAFPKKTWTGTDLQLVGFELDGPASKKVWLELDNVQFYR